MATQNIRPKILLDNGRVQQPLRVSILDGFSINPVKTFLTSDTASGSGTLTVKNIVGFAINQYLLIGEPGMQGSEIIKTNASTAPTGSTITLASNTILPHGASTFVYVLKFDQVEFSSAATIGGSKTVIQAATNILADQMYTEYNDLTATALFYFARFKESIGGTFSPYSDAAPAAGYGILSARAIIDAALGEINKTTSEVLSDTFAFTQLDMYQSEVIRELKRWSFMQKFNSIIGQVTTGSWKVAVPVDLDDQNTNKSVYNIRVGTEGRLTWVDKEKFDELLDDMAFTTLASIANVGDSTLTLTNSGDFGTSGTATIGAYTYPYTANNTTTGVLTLTSVIPASQNQAAGADVFLNPNSGLPNYWTTFGGYIYYLPITDATYNGFNLYLDYYSSQVRITGDNSTLVVPDPTAAINYLCWKFLKKLNNGEDTDASKAYQLSYMNRVVKMKNKEVLGKTFKMRPRYNNFAVQSEFDNGDGKVIRDGAFPDTGQ